ILDQILPGDGLVYLAKVALKKTRLENFKVVSGKKQKFFLYPGKSLYFHAAFNEKTPLFGLLVDFRGFVSLKIQLILLNDKCLCYLWKCPQKIAGSRHKRYRQVFFYIKGEINRAVLSNSCLNLDREFHVSISIFSASFISS